jgi:hypothetical protein
MMQHELQPSTGILQIKTLFYVPLKLDCYILFNNLNFLETKPNNQYLSTVNHGSD